VTPHLAASTEEAQDRAGVIVAEQVVAALEGGLVTNAVNIPTLRARISRRCAVRPARGEARPLAMELAQGRAERIELTVLRRARRSSTRGSSPSRR
jgi:D-3-phosphoglycerate dehydrogenase